MGVLGVDPPAADPARLVLERDRVCDGLRSMSLVRLAAQMADGRTRGQVAHGAAQQLADLCADLTGTPHRDVPVLPEHAVGDQVAVMANDLLAALHQQAESAPAESARVCQEGVSALVAVRLVL